MLKKGIIRVIMIMIMIIYYLLLLIIIVWSFFFLSFLRGGEASCEGERDCDCGVGCSGGINF